MPQFVLRPPQLRTKAATLKLPPWLDDCRNNVCLQRPIAIAVHFGLATQPCRLLRSKNHHFAKPRFHT